MNKHYLAPAYKYSVRSSLRSSLTFIGIMIAVIILNIVITLIAANNVVSAETTVSYYDFAALIMIFVVGICSVREDARVMIQHGIGRTTTFISQILTALDTALLLAIAGVIIMGIAQLVLSNISNIEAPLLYQLYTQQAGVANFTDYLLSIAIAIPLYLAGYLVGMLISLIFYRLPKPWKLVVAIGAPILVFVIIPIAVSYSKTNWLLNAIFYPLAKIIQFCAASTGNLIIFLLALSLIIGFFSWLLLRRAPIK